MKFHLTKKSSVGTKKRKLLQRISVICANVKRLTLWRNVCVISAFDATFAREIGVRHFRENRVILTRSSGNCHGQHVDGRGVVRGGRSVVGRAVVGRSVVGRTVGQQVGAVLVDWQLGVTCRQETCKCDWREFQMIRLRECNLIGWQH